VTPAARRPDWPRLARPLLWAGALVLSALYLTYAVFTIHNGRGPVDYETFMAIGGHFLRHEPVYYDNSYYPLPFVMIFAAFAWLPRPVSMGLWLLLPVVAALAIRRWQAAVLLFAPVFGHFVGGQSSFFGLVGIWGYRKYADLDRRVGGFFLALLTLKPQLALFPCVWALITWARALRSRRRVPAQAWAFLAFTAALYLPGFLFYPDWPLQWLSRPRPLFERALSGLVPRALLGAGLAGWVFWGLLILLAGALLLALWLLNQRRLDFDLFLLWSMVVNPLVHDYDLILLVPLLETTPMLLAAILLSIPGWWVILAAYSNDAAWAAFTLIAPGLLSFQLWHRARRRARNTALSLQPASP
jgi:hypothetical protein